MKARGFFLLLLITSIIPGLAGAVPDSLQNLKEVALFTTHDPHDAEFLKNYLFVADGNSLLVYDTADPERPRRVTEFRDFNEPGKVLGLSISKDMLYIAAGPGWIYVLNITDPEKPKKIYQIDYLNSANDVAVTEEYMFVADANTGMVIFDLSDKRNPQLAGKFYALKSNISGSLQGWGGVAVEVSGNYAFLSVEQRQGFYIIDISDPKKPREIFRSIGKNVYDIARSESGIYLARADGTSQFDLMNVSNPYSPEIVDTFSIIEIVDRSAIALHPSGNYIFAASGNTWHIYRIEDRLPPEVIIERPGPGEIFAIQTINITGIAFDKSGIKEVLVNGKFAGTGSWNQEIMLFEGINNITVTAFDERGNNITESIQVTYRPSVQPGTTTPSQTVNATSPAVQTGEEGKNTAKDHVLYNVILVVLLFMAIAVLIYWLWAHKIKR